MRRLTPGEARWPETSDFVNLALRWRQDAVVQLLAIVWKAYDLLRSEILSKIDLEMSHDDLERQLTQLLELRIRNCMTGYEPFQSQHGPFEVESRMPAPAQPPQYDIAFVWNGNQRLMWPLEAKVLWTDGSVAEYVKAINENFLTCRYAPFSGEAAMLGYLISGKGSKALDQIATRLTCVIEKHPVFANRDHGTSRHLRDVPVGKNYPPIFTCHHLIMLLD